MIEENQQITSYETNRPAKLFEPGQITVSQQSGDLPQLSAEGIDYETPDQRMYPPGWYIRHHFKRKHLRRSNKHYAEVDRISTQFIMLPMATGILVMILVLA